MYIVYSKILQWPTAYIWLLVDDISCIRPDRVYDSSTLIKVVFNGFIGLFDRGSCSYGLELECRV